MAKKKNGGPRVVNHVITYHELDGRRVKAGTPGATKRTTTTATYYAEIPRRRGERPERVPLRTTDEKEAWRLLAELLEQRARHAAGLSASPAIRHAVRPIEEHLADWETHLRDAGRTSAVQIGTMLSRLRVLVGLAGWQRLPQIDRASATAALARLTTQRTATMPAEYAGRSSRTRNHYLRHLKQWCRWATADGRLERDPVAAILPVEVTKRHPRRVPSDGDVAKLMTYLERADAPTRSGMTAAQRAMGYRVCMATGFRAKELRSLSRDSFDLSRATVTGEQAHMKNRKQATQPLPPWLVSELRDYFAANGRTWEGWPKDWPGRLLLLDQEACGVEHRTAAGFFDFHCLRKWFVSFAANSPGVSPKTLQTLARHSDARLTMEVYAEARQGEAREIVERMPRPSRDQSPEAPLTE